MKKLFSILLSIVMCISLSVFTFADTVDDGRFEFATEFLTKFYRYAYLCEVSDFSDYIASENFLTYINEYAESEYTKRVIQNSASKALEVEYEILDTHYYDDCVKYEVLSKLYFTYETYGNPHATDSGIMWRGSEIIVSGTEDFEILDWYCEFNDYTIRDEPASPDFWENQADADEVLTLLEERTEAALSFFQEVAAKTAAETGAVASESTTALVQPRVIWPLNKSAMVTWAKNNALASTLTSGNPSIIPTYFDFSTISNNFDCTNFASHAILAGGAPMYNNSNKSTGWYYVDAVLGNYSHSWSGVIKLHEFLTKSTGYGPHGREIEYSDIVNNNYTYVAGDLIQYHNGSKWSHTAIITGFKQVSDTKTIPLVTYRSSPTSRYIDAEYDYYPNATDYRIILLDGYYPE